MSERNDDAGVDFDSYVFPDTVARRNTGWALVGIGVLCVVAWALFRGGVVANAGVLAGGVVLIAGGLYFRSAAPAMNLDQADALVVAAGEIGFGVGHASATLGWRGLRSRPTWRILVYSSEDPPLERGMVLIDAIDGEVLASYREPNPEDWEQLRADEAARPA